MGMTGRLLWFVGVFLLLVSMVAGGQPTFPTECSDWATLEDPQDGVETFCNQDTHLDVIETHWFADEDYLYLRMCLRAHGGWPLSGIPVDPYDEARYKWFIDTDPVCNLTRPGGQVTGAEFLVFVEDYHLPPAQDNGLGEMYLIEDVDGNGNFNEWDTGVGSPYYPDWTAPGPPNSVFYRNAWATGQTPGATDQTSNAGDLSDIGFRIAGPNAGTVDNDSGCCTYVVDMYVSWSALDLPGPTDICVMWASETETQDLDAAEVCDRHNDSTPLEAQVATGTIVIVKEAFPTSGVDFSFSGDLGSFTLDDADPDDADGVQNSFTASGLEPGTYDVTESLPPGWRIDAISCCDCDPASGNTTASIDVGPDQTVQCVFINEELPPPTTGTITVVKDSLPEDPQDFSFAFTPDGQTPVVFSLDDADPDDADGVIFSRVFSELEPGLYTVTETVPAGWTLTSITNDNDGTPSNGVTIDLSAGDSVIVTFNNAKNGTIIVAKDSLPDDPQDVSFGGDLGAFTLDDADPDDGDGVTASATFSDLPPGDYTVTETVPASWSLQAITLTDAAGTVDLPGASATIALLPGEVITATFFNQLQTASTVGTIVVIKDSQPDDDQDFAFTGDLGTFTLDDANPDDADGNPFSRTFPNLPVGTYEIVEGAVFGWNLTAISVAGGTGSTSLPLQSASVTLAAGEVITVIFTNEQEAPTTGSIVIVKDTQPDSGQDFAFTGDLGEFSLDDDSDPTLPQQRTFGDLPPGTYTVAESVLSGWSLEEILCTHAEPVTDSNQVDIELAAGDVVSCVFTNVEREPLPGTIIVVKNAIPDSAQDFSFVGDLGSFSLDNPSADDGDAFGFERVFFDLPAGEYTVRELVPVGWALEGIEIQGTSGTLDLVAHSATVTVGDGTVTTIVFTNEERPIVVRPPTTGGGSSDNDPPVPVVGADRVVCVGETVCLDGSGSHDPDGDTLRYAWTFSVLYMAGGEPVYKIPAGSGVAGTLVDADTATPCFVPDIPGEYVLLLTVTDEDGAATHDEIRILADPCEDVRRCCLEEGWNLFSPPLHLRDASLDALQDATGLEIVVRDYEGGYQWADAFSPFGGYWVWAEAYVCFDLQGMIPETGVRSLDTAGWHLVGAPFAIEWTDIRIRFHSVEMPMNDAIQRGFISAYPICYDPLNASYAYSDTILPCRGYWIETLQNGLELLFDERSSLSNAAQDCRGSVSQDPPLPPALSSIEPVSVAVGPIPAFSEVAFEVLAHPAVDRCRVVIFDLARTKVWEGEAAGSKLVWPLVLADGRDAANGPYIFVVEAMTGGDWSSVRLGVLFVKR